MSEPIFVLCNGYRSEYGLREAFEVAAAYPSDTEDALRGIGSMLAVLAEKLSPDDQLAVLNAGSGPGWRLKEPAEK